MFTDMVGFSRKMGSDEVQAMTMLLVHDRILSEIITAHNGRVLKKMGDAFFAEFGSAVSAVQCAVAIQTALKEHNTVSKPDEQIVIRIGIHLGDVVVQGDDLYGEGVNVAARLEPLAEPGGICLSQAIYQAVKSQSSVEAVHVGEVELKNILEKYVVYRIAPLYAVEKKGEAPATHSSASGELRFKVKSVKPQATIGRSRWLYALKWVAIRELFLIAIMVTLLIHGHNTKKNYSKNDPFLMFHSEVRDPISLVNKFREPSDPVSRFIHAGLTSELKQQISAYDGRSKVPKDLLEKIKAEIGHIVAKSRPWNIPEFFETDTVFANKYSWTLANPSPWLEYEGYDYNAWKFNLSLFRTYYEHDLSFENDLQRGFKMISNTISEGYDSFSDWMEAGIYVLLLFFIGSPTSLRVTFTDLRGVDQGVTFLTSEMNFRRRRQDSRGIHFRRWGFLGSIFQNLGGMRVRVDGNTILLTSSNIVIQRAKKLFKQHLAES